MIGLEWKIQNKWLAANGLKITFLVLKGD